MANHGERTGRDTLDAVLQRLHDVEIEVQHLKGGRRTSFDRGDVLAFPPNDGSGTQGAFEGQVMVQYANASTYNAEQPYYFSSNEWRPFFSPSELGIAEEHLYVNGATAVSTTVTTLPWTRYDGDTIVDVSTPTAPTASTAAVFAVTADFEIFLPGSEPVGDGFDIALTPVQVAPAWPAATPFGSQMTVVNANDTFDVLYGSVSVTNKMAAGDRWGLSIFNRTGYSVTVRAGITVVRISTLF